jgi:hypothetical protein
MMAMDLVMGLHGHQQAAAGRTRVRRSLPVLMALALAGTVFMAAAPPRLEVTEAHGIYHVAATFAVPESPEAVLAVLTDYERIPDYMPDVEVSRVVDRSSNNRRPRSS